MYHATKAYHVFTQLDGSFQHLEVEVDGSFQPLEVEVDDLISSSRCCRNRSCQQSLLFSAIGQHISHLGSWIHRTIYSRRESQPLLKFQNGLDG